MRCAYNLGIQENKKIINEITQNANTLRNEVNSCWRQLEEEGKEEVKHDYQLAYDNYVKMDNLIQMIEMFYKYLYKIITTVKTIHVHVKE